VQYCHQTLLEDAIPHQPYQRKRKSQSSTAHMDCATWKMLLNSTYHDHPLHTHINIVMAADKGRTHGYVGTWQQTPGYCTGFTEDGK
jgi:hypothetical protein